MKTALRHWTTAILLGVVVMLPAQADPVRVEVHGIVEFNEYELPTSFNRFVVKPGDTVVVSFLVDSETFQDLPALSRRNYPIDQASYTLTFLTATGPLVEPLRAPYPFNYTPNFVLADSFPSNDSFGVLSTSPFQPTKYLFLDERSDLDPTILIEQALELGYSAETIESLDILDNLGTYGESGLTRVLFVLLDSIRERMLITFTHLTISREPVAVPVDFRPGECPNSLNPKSHGVLPLAILGTAELDVTTIDPLSIRLNGVAPLGSSLADVGTPFEPFVGKAHCTADCNDSGADGLLDLVLHFDTEAVAATLGSPAQGDCVLLHLTGNFSQEFHGGGPIAGEDVALIVGNQH